MSILDKLFQKRGIKNIDELEPEEKAQYEEWRKILSKEELSISDIKEFCQTEIAIIEGKWKDRETTNEKKAELIPYHTVYKTLEQLMIAPRSERENLEAQLNQLLID